MQQLTTKVRQSPEATLAPSGYKLLPEHGKGSLNKLSQGEGIWLDTWKFSTEKAAGPQTFSNECPPTLFVCTGW